MNRFILSVLYAGLLSAVTTGAWAAGASGGDHAERQEREGRTGDACWRKMNSVWS